MRQKLIPSIIQDAHSNKVYMLGYMNEKSLKKTRESGYVWFWSRKKMRFWMKGETSGNKLRLKEIYSDCDSDALLVKVELIGSNVCHTGNKSCFFTELSEYL